MHGDNHYQRQLEPQALLYSVSFGLKGGLYLFLQLSTKCYPNSLWERTCQRAPAAQGERSLCPFVPDAIKNGAFFLSRYPPPPSLVIHMLQISQRCLRASLAALPYIFHVVHYSVSTVTFTWNMNVYMEHVICSVGEGGAGVFEMPLPGLSNSIQTDQGFAIGTLIWKIPEYLSHCASSGWINSETKG